MLLSISCFTLQAQECGTDLYHQHLLNNNQQYRERYEAMEEKYVESMLQKQRSTQNSSFLRSVDNICEEQVYIVPVVVHVLHIGEPIGNGINISDAQIKGAIDQLNKDFRNQSGVSVNISIQFVLATLDPNGNPTIGINRINASALPEYSSCGVKFNFTNNITCGVSPDNITNTIFWDNTRYLNIGIVNLLDNGNYAGVSMGLNGVFVTSIAMRSSSRTLTHEVGHSFNLGHTFLGDSNNNCPANNNCLVDGDKVCDTPPHRQIDCTITPSNCYTSGVWTNSIYNFMSYCSGNRDRFTLGQKQRMRISILNSSFIDKFIMDNCLPYNSLREVGILGLTTPYYNCESSFLPRLLIKNYAIIPLRALKIVRQINGLKDTLNIINLNISARDTSTLILREIPLNIGDNMVSLEIIDINGLGVDSFIYNNKICKQISYNLPTNVYPHCADFETAYFPIGWRYEGSIDTFTLPANRCDSKGKKALILQGANDLNSTIMMSKITSNTIDLRQAKSSKLIYSRAHRRNTQGRISFNIETSEDCGKTFKYLKVLDDVFGTLETVPISPSTTTFIPQNCQDWKNDTIDLTKFKGKQILLEFKVWGNGSPNNFFIDNLCIETCDLETKALVTNISCQGQNTGVAHLTLSGDTTGISFKWSNGQTTQSLQNAPAGRYTVIAKNIKQCADTVSVQITEPSQINSSVSVTPIKCSGGTASAQINATGGNGTLSFKWSNGKTGSRVDSLVAGNYTITITDSLNCTIFKNVTIESPPVLTSSLIVNPTTCEKKNGRIEIQVGGGTLPYVYALDSSLFQNSNIFQNLPSGMHTAKVKDANGCETQTAVTITNQGEAVNLTISGNTTACKGDTIVLAVVSGLNTYAWSNGQRTASTKVTQTGNYSVTATNASGCTGNTSISITFREAVNLNISGNTTACKGDTILLSVASGLTTYTWSNGQTTASTKVTQTDNYSVTATNASGCTGNTSINVTFNPRPKADFGFNVQGGKSQFVSLSADTNSTTIYRWDLGNGTTSNLKNPIGNYSADGIYYICLWLTNGTGCKDSICKQINISRVAVQDISNEFKVCIYPNPNNGQFVATVSASDKETDITIQNSRGQVIWKGRIAVGQESRDIQLADAANGLYFVSYRNGEGLIKTVKFVINR